MDINTIRNAVKNCDICFDSKTKIVNLPCGNSNNPKFMIVGESPSLNPTLPRVRNTLLITPTGEILHDTLKNLGVIDRLTECYFTNTIKCAYRNALGQKKNCVEKFLKYELLSIQPKILITLGTVAKVTLNELNTKKIKIFNLPHPSAIRKHKSIAELYEIGVNKIKRDCFEYQG